MENPEKVILDRIKSHEIRRRVALSRKYPLFKRPVSFFRCLLRYIRNLFDYNIRYTRSNEFFPYVIASCQSPLRRKSGDNNPGLQDHKIINMKRAIEKLNGIVINPEKANIHHDSEIR